MRPDPRLISHRGEPASATDRRPLQAGDEAAARPGRRRGRALRGPNRGPRKERPPAETGSEGRTRATSERRTLAPIRHPVEAVAMQHRQAGPGAERAGEGALARCADADDGDAFSHRSSVRGCRARRAAFSAISAPRWRGRGWARPCAAVGAGWRGVGSRGSVVGGDAGTALVGAEPRHGAGWQAGSSGVQVLATRRMLSSNDPRCPALLCRTVVRPKLPG